MFMNEQNRKNTYEDIIDLPHHRSRKHPPMKVADRAAQFAPFAALTGFEDAVKETARITERKHELTEDKIAEINECLMRLQENSGSQPELMVTWFVPDGRKDGGAYQKIRSRMQKLDVLNGRLYLKNGEIIEVENISEIGML